MTLGPGALCKYYVHCMEPRPLEDFDTRAGMR